MPTVVDDWESGRQSIAKFRVENKNLIRRHYCRGGLPARITRDKFVFRGLEASRPYRELKLLGIMQQLHLPVPEPIAARCIVNGLTYRADIIIGEIENAKTIAQMLSRQKLEKSDWRQIGSVIRQFHENDIQHVDLNANNIIKNDVGEIYLIDFDRCVQKQYKEQWGESVLNRLRRSLRKFKKNNPSFNFQENDFIELLAGYQD